MTMTPYNLEDLSEDNQAKANQLIAERIKAAYDLISECESIADKANCRFSFELTYGGGCFYNPENKGQEDDYGDISDGWVASSTTC
jgi:hypothetical protein